VDKFLKYFKSSFLYYDKLLLAAAEHKGYGGYEQHEKPCMYLLCERYWGHRIGAGKITKFLSYITNI
jgi:hypothetical protein